MNMDDKTAVPPLDQSPTRRFTLLAVDDAPENLDVLVACLRDHYHIRGAASGDAALKMVEKHRPDLILMDVMMPGIDGFETCRRLKLDKDKADIPVIFVTSLNEVKDERVGFAAGGVDYIVKPIIPAVLLARIHTHLALREAQRAVQNILNQTLAGTISVMTEVLSLANPMAFGRAMRLRSLIQKMVKRIGRADAWQFELSAILSQLGCVTLPTSVLQKFQQGIMTSMADQDRYERYPELSAKLVARIPRLEEVARMVEMHLKPPCAPFQGELKTRPLAVLGAQILKMAIDYDTQKLGGRNPVLAVQNFYMDRHNYDPALVAILEEVVTTDKTEQQVVLSDLRPGMVLAADMLYESGECLLRSGTELTVSTLNLLSSLEYSGMIRQPVAVLVTVE
ncbi:MAG: response regulator [Magnetococcus sp. DMHC-8]